MRAYRYLAGVAGLIAGLWVGAPAKAADCMAPSQAEIEQLHVRWAASLATMHPDKVLRNYAPDATMIGLETPTLLADHMAIRNHYVYFLQREPKIEVQDHVVRTTCAAATDTGAMVMSLRPKAKAAHENVTVRYSLSYEQLDGKWLITHHHLSIAEPAPRQVSAAPDHQPPLAANTPPPKAPAVAGYVKRLQPAKAQRAPAAAKPAKPATERLQDGTTYTPAIWRNNVPNFPDD